LRCVGAKGEADEEKIRRLGAIQKSGADRGVVAAVSMMAAIAIAIAIASLAMGGQLRVI